MLSHALKQNLDYSNGILINQEWETRL